MTETEKAKFDESIRRAVETIRKGGIILYPTDTIWGLGCDATNAEAVAKIFKLKQRDDAKSMLSLVDSIDALYRRLKNVPETALSLIDVAVSPLTIIYDSPIGFADNLLAEDGSIGIRITNERFSKALCRRAGVPVVSTSANISGEKSPSIFDEISQEIIDGVDYVVEYGRENRSTSAPSAIIKVMDDETFKLIR